MSGLRDSARCEELEHEISFLRSMIDDALSVALQIHPDEKTTPYPFNTVIAVLQRALSSDAEDAGNHP